MAPDIHAGSDDHNGSRSSKGADTSAAEAALKARLSRKRTKTGCLTCRKRRIKCGEERPVCENCIKSKRHCEGYNQRVIFKPPSFDFRPVPNGGAHITFQAGPVPGPTTSYQNDMAHPPFDAAAYPDLRPRPLEHFTANQSQPIQQHPDPNYPALHHTLLSTPSMGNAAPYHPQVVLSTNDGYHQQAAAQSAHQQNLPTYYPGPPAIYNPILPQERTSQNLQHVVTDGNPQTRFWDERHTPTHNKVTWSNPGTANTGDQHFSPASTRSSKTLTTGHQPYVGDASQPWSTVDYLPRPEIARPTDYQSRPTIETQLQYPPEASMAPLPQPSNHVTPEFYDYEAHVPLTLSPNYMLNDAAIEAQDDDYYDVQSDEEMDVDVPVVSNGGFERQQTLSRILQMNRISVQDLQTRRYDTFIYEGMLDTYRVERVANPLRNAATARVFAHFIAVTGPSLSVFERHPRNTSVLFTEGHIPFSQQGLWTYTMPMAALHHQGLLHAMLAMASLHIARLTGACATPSIQHYAWALKRIHHCVGHPKKRLKLSTIAASMLLGYYEIMTADHMKWNMHLAGSKQLFVETDFVGMTRQFRLMKKVMKAQQQFGRSFQSDCPTGHGRDDILAQILDVDERMISHLIGREVRYEDHGEIVTPQSGVPQELDLNKFEILKDLYWWYCKQDAYQSIISGNPLLMDYSRWANCPPRAPLGRPGAIYGSFDHLVLLLARIADFSARDRARKLQQMELNGGHWRPAPGMKMPRPPQQPPPPTPVSGLAYTQGLAPMVNQQQQGPSYEPINAPPMFYGMAPPPRSTVQMPSSYQPINGIVPPQHTPVQDPVDLQVATQAALEEYGRIRAALHTFSTSLGDAFRPLSPEEQPPLETPFGTALSYRSYDIGCLWAVYNMAIIITIRSHPHMPPAAHMAAAIAAQETSFFANQIGRIAAGIVPGPPDQPLNPSLGSALSESCLPCFFAAVQYHDPDQRHSTVMRIFSIAQRTGWGSAELIANGCETAWVKAAAAGRGPPYERVMRPSRSDDPRLNGSWERLDPDAQPDGKDDGDRRLVRMKANARLNWGIGIIGTEEDLKISS